MIETDLNQIESSALKNENCSSAVTESNEKLDMISNSLQLLNTSINTNNVTDLKQLFVDLLTQQISLRSRINACTEHISTLTEQKLKMKEMMS